MKSSGANFSVARRNNGSTRIDFLMSKQTKLENKIDVQWILIRGLGREARHWGELPEQLQKVMAAEFGETRVDAIDLPGAGRYSEMKAPLTMLGLTEFVREKFLEIRERQRQAGLVPASRTYLLAVSLGGMIAAQWLDRWPGDFQACVLVNTSFKGYSPMFKRLTPPALGHLAKIFTSGAAEKAERRVLEMVSNRPELYEATAREWAKIQMDRPISFENFGRQLFAAATFSAKLEQPPCPVLILGSAKDRMVDPSCSRVIAERWNAPLIQHPKAGHDLPLDDAPWIVEQARVFLSKAR
jgi:pimeloyl-ACP methyl ester carboxylesterase